MKTILLLLVLCSSATAQEHRPTVLSAPGGRFVFGQISNMRKDQYMLDTATGRLWEVTEDTNGMRSLAPVHYFMQGHTPPLALTNSPPDTLEIYRIRGDFKAFGIDAQFSTNTPTAK